MKKTIVLMLLILLQNTFISKSQVFWAENFDSVSSSCCLSISNYNSPNGAWALYQPYGYDSNGSAPNTWFVSCSCAGNLVGKCQSSCSAGSNLGATLHIGPGPLDFFVPTDDGAYYDEEGDLAGIVCITNCRAKSPVINCAGRSGINLRFCYIEGGDGIYDFGAIWYSPDNGATWGLLVNIPQSAFCATGAPGWDIYNVALPPSADYNPTVKIGFGWVNQDGGYGGTSVAIDSITLDASFSTGIANVGANENKYWVSQSNGNNFTIYSASPVNENMNILVYNTLGQTVLKDELNKGESFKNCNGSNLVPGIYAIKIINDNSVLSVLKFIKS